jgi:ferredoxin
MASAMNTVLYYFSGTGNSLKVARDLSVLLPRSRIESMAGYVSQRTVEPDAGLVGLVFPMYFFGLPDIVLQFVGKLELGGDSAVFAVVTRGGTPGWGMQQLKMRLGKKAKQFRGGFYVTMGTNYILRHKVSSANRLQKLFRRSRRKLLRICRFMEGGRKKVFNDLPGFCWIARFFYQLWMRDIHQQDRNFTANEGCTSCGTCERVCPVGNIRLVDGKPRWDGRCQQCLACLHFCPVTAIQFGEKTEGKQRYHHPDVTAADIAEQKMLI